MPDVSGRTWPTGGRTLTPIRPTAASRWRGQWGYTWSSWTCRCPFTAGRAETKGWASAGRRSTPRIRFIQFVDGDCELVGGWLERAHEVIESHPEVAVGRPASRATPRTHNLQPLGRHRVGLADRRSQILRRRRHDPWRGLRQVGGYNPRHRRRRARPVRAAPTARLDRSSDRRRDDPARHRNDPI